MIYLLTLSSFVLLNLVLDPLYLFEIGNNITLVVYKPGYKVAQKIVTVNPDEGLEVNIQLDEE